MRLCTFAPPSKRPRIGFVTKEKIIDLYSSSLAYRREKGSQVSSAIFLDMIRLLEGGDKALELAKKVGEYGSRLKVTYDPKEVKLLAPVPRPSLIICLGLNYESHVEATGFKRPTSPIGFLKASSCVAGPYDDVILPRTTKQLDYEAELAVVIGKKSRYIPEEKALDYVAGYTVSNDISARDILWREMEFKMILLGKSMQTFAPMGPYLVTKDEIPDPQVLDIECKVNGDVRLKSTSREMIFNVRKVVSHYSTHGFLPGDVIMTGTPGAPAFTKKPDPTPFFLKVGDVVETFISKIGTIRNRIVAD